MHLQSFLLAQFLSEVLDMQPVAVIVDSIQTMYPDDITGAA